MMKTEKKEFEQFENELIEIQLKKESENDSEKLRISIDILKHGFVKDGNYIKGCDMYSFAIKNPNIVGNQIFDVIKGDNFKHHKAFYFSTENAFVDIFDDSIWYQNEENGNWDNRLDGFFAKPIFINIY